MVKVACRVNSVDSSKTLGRPRRLRFVVSLGAVVLAVSGLLASCSASGSKNEAGSGQSAVTPEEISLWFDRVADLMYPCDAASRQTATAVETFASGPGGTDFDLAIVLAAGNGVEQCSPTGDAGLTLTQMQDVPGPMVPFVDAAKRWVSSMEQTNLAILVAAADNIDSRVLVGAAFDKQAEANAAADEFDVVLAGLLGEVGLQLPENVQLLRWKIETQ